MRAFVTTASFAGFTLLLLHCAHLAGEPSAGVQVALVALISIAVAACIG